MKTNNDNALDRILNPQNPLLNLSPNFVIPPGSQVVLLVTKSIGKGLFKKPGTVGIVLQSPPNNSEEYLIQFTDDATATATFKELTLRRQEIEHLLEAGDGGLREFIIYRCQVGSKAFGLSNESSDDDIRGIFLPPADLHWSLYRLPEQIELIENGEDEVYWELEKFIRLALKANPNILETLWTPRVIDATPIAKQLREIRGAFLSQHIYKTYSGYVISQFRRMKNSFEKKGQFKVKHAMHLIRLLYSGIAALETGEIMVDVSEHRDELLSIRNGDWKFEEIRRKALSLDKDFQRAFDKTHLPEQPNLESVNQFLIDARRSVVN